MFRMLLLTLVCSVELVLTPLLGICAVLARLFARRETDVGLGPLPLVSHPHTQKALRKYGYTCETFVYKPYFLTSKFDFRADRFPGARMLGRRAR